MTGNSYWKGVKRLSKLCKKHRRITFSRKLPLIKEFCKRYGIEMLPTSHGYQFRRAEYIVNWSPSTNRIQVQYSLSGHYKTVPFEGSGKYNRPKVLIALEEVVEASSFNPQFV